MLKLLDGELLFADDVFDKVADGQHADDFAFVQNGEVADALRGHQRHAFFVGLFRTDP